MKKSDNLNKNIKFLTLGIRYDRSFRIPDILGEVIDNILRYSPFPENFFTIVEEKVSGEKKLLNKEDINKNYLRINTDDLIIGLEIDGNYEEKYQWLNEEIIIYFINEFFIKYKINNINRVGLVIEHVIDVEQIKIGKVIEYLTNKNLDSANKLNIAFSKKYPDAIGTFKKNVNNYKNINFILELNDKNTSASLDFQQFFIPKIEDIRDCNINKFFEDASNYLVEHYSKWYEK